MNEGKADDPERRWDRAAGTRLERGRVNIIDEFSAENIHETRAQRDLKTNA